jgi:hypothetical protein
MTEEWEASEIFYVYEVFANKKKRKKRAAISLSCDAV